MRSTRSEARKLDDDAVLEALCRAFLSRGARAAEALDADATSVPRGTEPDSRDASASGEAPYRVAVTVCAECRRGWRHGGGAVAEMSPAATDCARCDALWIGDVDSDDVERARQEIPPATRRKVLHRDHARCRVPGCSCYANLDIHHIVHREHGGTNDLTNLITLCEAHHLAHHDGTLAIERVDGDLRFRREGRNNFTRATREVATRQALRDRGLGREVIESVMARTVSHVGGTNLMPERWLEIAQSYVDVLAT